MRLLLLASLFILSGCISNNNQDIQAKKSHQELLSDFVEMRHGMFICFNIMSYGAEWSEANYPIDSFNPTKLDCDQWAEAAQSANMSYGILTTKHHEGFALWDSKLNEYDVAASPYKKDIVRQFVDAFRRHKLKIGLYYSILDTTNGIDSGEINDEKINFIKSEITELLSNYGKIDYFVIDGWYWRMGHREVPYVEIRDLIRQLQPDCLITDHTHLQAPYHVDIPYFEGPFGAFPPENNSMASALGHCPAKGNGWFWSDATPTNMVDDAESIVEILRKCEARYCNFMLNCMPNRDGLLDDNYIAILKEIGSLWSPDMSRPPLPEQATNIRYEVEIQSAIATSGEASNLIAARQLGTDYTEWISDNKPQQSITLDLGAEYTNINILNFVQAHNCKPAPERALADGNILTAKLYSSSDNKEYNLVSQGHWDADAAMRSMKFSGTSARYLRLDIEAYSGDKAIIIEMQVGNCDEPLDIIRHLL